MYYLDHASRKKLELAPGVFARTFWGDQMMLSLVDFEPGAEVPKHHHPHEQVGVVLHGKLMFVIGGEEKVLEAGEMYIIPGGVSHSARAIGSDVSVLDVFHPVREEYQY